jgi:drug/metabolite transporter (DMT)-like permease
MAKRSVSSGLIWAALITVYIVWGSTYLAIRVAVESMPPLLMAGVRFLIAGAVLFVWRMAANKTHAAPTWRHWRAAAIVAALLMVGGNGGVALAERTVPSGFTALVAATVPLWMALFDRLWFGRALAAQAVAGLIIGFAAVAFLIGSPGAEALSAMGATTAIVAAVAWAIGSLYARGAKLPDDALLAIGMEMLAGGALLLIGAAITGEFSGVASLHPSAAAWWAFSYLVVFGALIGFSAYLWLLRVAPTARVSTYAYVNPIIAVYLGWLILREPVGIRTIIAGAAILAAVAIIVWVRPNAEPVEVDRSVR